jgi:CheY-like chemotaxis protein
VIAKFLPPAASANVPEQQDNEQIDSRRGRHALDARMVAAVLQGAGYEVAEAGDGVEALELARSACSTWW